MRFRSAQHTDAANLAALAVQVWLHTYATEGISSTISSYVLSEFTAERFEVRLSDPSYAVLVAETSGNLVGYATVCTGAVCPEHPSAKAELVTLYVQEHFVGRGVGSSLLKEAELHAKQLAGSSLWLTVNCKNSRAIAFYAKHAYAPIGISYFRLGGEDHENLVLVGRDA